MRFTSFDLAHIDRALSVAAGVYDETATNGEFRHDRATAAADAKACRRLADGINKGRYKPTLGPDNYIVSVTSSGFIIAGFQMVDHAWLFLRAMGPTVLTVTCHGEDRPASDFDSADDLLLWSARLEAA